MSINPNLNQPTQSPNPGGSSGGLNALGLPRATHPSHIIQHLGNPAVRQAVVHHLASIMPPPPIDHLGSQPPGVPAPLAGAPGVGAAPMQDLRMMHYSRIFTPNMPIPK